MATSESVLPPSSGAHSLSQSLPTLVSAALVPGTKTVARRLPNVTEILSEIEKSAIVEMALSDHVSFAQIEAQYGLPEKEVKALMRDLLKSGSYRAWRKRVRSFADRREHYK